MSAIMSDSTRLSAFEMIMPTCFRPFCIVTIERMKKVRAMK